MSQFLATEADTLELARTYAPQWRAGDLVLLQGPLGVGKTTFVRYVADALGFQGPVRSPTFTLIQALPTDPPIAHVDLYRLSSAQNIGIEDYRATHLVIVEWPERAPELLEEEGAWLLRFSFVEGGRCVDVSRIGVAE